MQITAHSLHEAQKYLISIDPILAPVIEGAGLCTMLPHRDYYGALVNSIIGQQLSVKAAAAIKSRVWALFDDELPTPEQILSKTHDELRAAGLSNAKVNYVQDLAEHVVDGRIHFRDIAAQTNEQIIAELTDVKGVGEWTAQMFLMFCVGRSDVLPVGDLGVRNGVGILYGLGASATQAQVIEIAEKYHWAPYQSIASWYIWRSLDNAPKL